MNQDDAVFSRLPVIESVYFESVSLDKPFEEVAGRFAQKPGTVVLLSGGDLDSARFHFLAANPWLSVSSKRNTLKIRHLGRKTEVTRNPLDFIDALVNKLSTGALSSDLPAAAGFFGYFAYDLKDRIETLPRTCLASPLPDICLYAPSQILIHDKESGTTTLAVPRLGYENSSSSSDSCAKRLRDDFFNQLANFSSGKGDFFIDSSGFTSTFTKSEYIEAAEKVINYLKAGDIYQANLSQRFETSFSGDAYALFSALYKNNPAPFFAFVNAGDHQIISTSPERFISRDGEKIETRPIKGTIPRGATSGQDRENGNALLSSPKDDAELTMIVDLMRNDLSRVAKNASVMVAEHKRLEPYDNVFHLVSVVQAALMEGKSSVDLLRAAFPGGSVTGCPKIRSMEIIDELEPVSRHVYTGAIGYLSFHETMDLSIAIRTATVFNNRLVFSVGGGIVFDSDPAAEYQETLDKGKTIMETLSQKAGGKSGHAARAWVNGRIVGKEQAVVSAACSGFQYGAGLFETLRVDNGVIRRLGSHVRRLENSWQELFGSFPPDVTWEDVIRRVISENRLEKSTAAVKIILAKDEEKSFSPCFAAVFARPYVHRLSVLRKTGLSLIRYPFSRGTPIADHKSLNYLYYLRAGSFAKEHSADEAVIFNPDNTVSETNTCSLFAVNGSEVIVPLSDHVLGGVTVNAALAIVEQAGYTVRRERMDFESLMDCQGIILTNALMGAVPVLDIEGAELKRNKDLVNAVNKGLFGQTSPF
ncbi:MAG: aminodeoxychorismate synthase component I [Thermodesulfobacteriota bacterium]